MRTTRFFVGGLLLGCVITGPVRAQDTADRPAEGYAWAQACKACHGAIYDAWSKTKHARTIERLDEGQRQSACVGCHVSGPRHLVTDGATVLNGSVQCECCHGPGRAHVEAATAAQASPGALMKKPDQRVCESCHNDQGPHYRGFFFRALVPLVHRTQ